MTQRRNRSRLYLVRVIRGRPRLFIALAVGAAVAATLSSDLRLAPRLLAGWDVFIALYLVLTGEMMVRARVSAIQGHAAIADEGRIGILVLTSAAALASFGAIIAELGTSAGPGSTRQPRQLILAILTIFLSWTFTHTIFALHYAHEYHRQKGEGAGCLVFPGGEPPDYWDFVYFSFVIGMTSQVSDVAIADKWMRRTATAHGVLSFVFNAAILALTVNIAASAL